MRKNIFKLFTFLLFLFSATSCEDFLDINENPLAASSADRNLLFPQVVVSYGANRTVEMKPGMNFFSQHMASSGSAGVFLNPERYILSNFTTGNSWSNYYTSCLKHLFLIRRDAQAAGQDLVVAQVKIMEAMLYLDLTQIWEEVPFTEAVNPEFTQPKFDDQQTILNGIVALIDEANSLISSTESTVTIAAGDMIYGGDMDKWVKFGNSVKFKALVLLHNGGQDSSGALNAMVGQPMVTTIADEPKLPFFDEVGSENNIWKVLNQFSGGQNVWFFAGEALIAEMTSLNGNAIEDPRLATYFDGGSPYVGVPPGTTGIAGESAVSLNILRPDFPEKLISASEILLLHAEMAAKGVISGGMAQADAYLRAGVQLSMDQWDGQPGAIAASDKSAYIAAIPALTSVGSTQIALDLIYQQQYIDLFFRGIEGWTMVRRTGYPNLPVPEQAVLGSLIRRYSYAPDEIATNPNHPAQKALDAPMWFEGN